MLESCFQLRQEDALQDSNPKREGEIMTSQREALLGAIPNGKPSNHYTYLGRCSDTLQTKAWPVLMVLKTIW